MKKNNDKKIKLPNLPPSLPHAALCKAVLPLQSGRSIIISFCQSKNLTISVCPKYAAFDKEHLSNLETQLIFTPKPYKYLTISI